MCFPLSSAHYSTENSNLDPKSRKLTEFGPKIAFRVPNQPKSDKFKEFGPETQFRGPNQSQNCTILEETQEDLHTETGEFPACGFAIFRNGARTPKSKF